MRHTMYHHQHCREYEESSLLEPECGEIYAAKPVPAAEVEPMPPTTMLNVKGRTT